MIISNCKINLGLNIISKREDGYHELDMIMAPIIFGDEIDIICHDELGELEFRIKDDLIPIDKSKALSLLREGMTVSISISLTSSSS